MELKNLLLTIGLMFSTTLVSALEFTEPLDLRRWFVEILSGSPAIFTAIALLSIFAIAGFFRMNILVTGFMVGAFFLMFSTVVDQSIYFIILVVGAIVIGITISKIVKR